MPAPGGHPASLAKNFWIPAFTGMTDLQERTPRTLSYSLFVVNPITIAAKSRSHKIKVMCGETICGSGFQPRNHDRRQDHERCLYRYIDPDTGV